MESYCSLSSIQLQEAEQWVKGWDVLQYWWEVLYFNCGRITPLNSWTLWTSMFFSPLLATVLLFLVMLKQNLAMPAALLLCFLFFVFVKKLEPKFKLWPFKCLLSVVRTPTLWLWMTEVKCQAGVSDKCICVYRGCLEHLRWCLFWSY